MKFGQTTNERLKEEAAKLLRNDKEMRNMWECQKCGVQVKNLSYKQQSGKSNNTRCGQIRGASAYTSACIWGSFDESVTFNASDFWRLHNLFTLHLVYFQRDTYTLTLAFGPNLLPLSNFFNLVGDIEQ